MTTEHPKTAEGYQEIMNTRGYIVDVPGHPVWYGVDTLDEALTFTEVEKIALLPLSSVNR